jgi:protein O-GlcNAc transferase
MFLKVLNLFASKSGKISDEVSLDRRLDQARALYGLGQAAQATAIFEEILGANPNHFEAIIFAAEVAAGEGKRDLAIGRYDRAISLDPAHPAAYYKRGNLLKDIDQLELALDSYDRAIELDARHSNAFCNRGVVLQRLGRLEPALASYEQAVQLNPNDALAYYNRGSVLRELKRPEEAIASLDHAIRLQPNYAEAHCNRGILNQEMKRGDVASTDFDRAIQINPDFSEAFLNRGNLLREEKDPTAALASYERAIQIDAFYVEAYCNRGIVLTEMRCWDAASTSINRAIELRPNYPEAYNARGRLLFAQDQKEAALLDYNRAIELNPVYAEAMCNRGSTLVGLKNFVDAIASYDLAINLQPDMHFLLGIRRHARMYVCDWRDLALDVSLLAQGISAGAAVSHPFPMLALLEAPGLHQRAAQIWILEHHTVDVFLATPPLRSAVGGKIRIGYFSADFRDHPVGILAVELFESHDRNRYEVFAFSFGLNTGGRTRNRLEAAVDRFIDVREMTDKEIAVLSRSLGIDIAIDLGGHTDDCRTQVFALRAAPVQVNYLGYPGTLGADYIDYLIGDSTVVPEELRKHYSEKIVHLPNSFMPHDSSRRVSSNSFLRREFGLPQEGFVFCCFNNNYKITPTTFASWMRIMRRVADSVLWLSASNPLAAANLRQEALRHGVASERLVFAGYMASSEEHLARLRLADLFLDTRPYNAHATALDALWAGLPVLTCLGEGFAGRVAASLLRAIKLPELVTATSQEYEDLAVELAGDPGLMADIRRRLAENRDTTPLFDTALLCRHIEGGYFQMHQRHVAGLLPDHLFVEH